MWLLATSDSKFYLKEAGSIKEADTRLEGNVKVGKPTI